MAIQATNQIKVGDYVRLRGHSSPDGYLGKVINEKVVRILTVENNKGDHFGTLAEDLEVAPRLTEDEAWAELPYLILGQINKLATIYWGKTSLLETDYRQIRHEAYKLLGGAGIKVDESVKERVRKAIKRMADAMGLELA